MRGVRPPPLLAKPCKKKCFQKVLFHMVGLFVCLLACLLVCLLSQREGSDHLSCWPCHAMPCHVNMLFILLLYQSYPKYIYIYIYIYIILCCSPLLHPSRSQPSLPNHSLPCFFRHQFGGFAQIGLEPSSYQPLPIFSHCPSLYFAPHWS